MKNISLFSKIIIANIIIVFSFMFIFVYKNYTMVYSYLDSLDEQKFQSIARTVIPVISINLSLGIKSGYVDSMQQLLKTHPEIYAVKLLDTSKKIIYQIDVQDKSKESKKQNKYRSKIYDSLTETFSGYFVIYYTHSKSLETILNNYNAFLVLMSSLFLMMMMMLFFLIFYAIKPLKNLTQSLIVYEPGLAIDLTHKDEKNEIAVINNAIVDMSQRVIKELEKRLAYEKELAQKNRLASMGRMIDNIAHQWRQPLMTINIILMNIDRSYELKKLDEVYLERKINEIVSITNHMSNTIEDFRNFFRHDKEEKEFSLNDVILQAKNLLQSSLGNVAFIVEDNDLMLRTYQSELLQVIITILSNATEIFEQKNIQKRYIKISTIKHKEIVDILIEDNAGGILEENLERIFEPYFTTKHQFGGTGLGLYICKVIIEENMGGKIDVKNNNDGVVFSLSLKYMKEKKCETI